MRLLDTRTIELKEFFDQDIPDYAILSHRWKGRELTFQDMKLKHRSQLPDKPGYAKVYSFCDKAKREGYRYCWIDTCCIDKRSSAELSEAINSMYSWYEAARVCFVYLADLPSGRPEKEMLSAFRSSEWFTRGWTLQELLAPRQVIFLDCSWNLFGERNSLRQDIYEVTSIEPEFLLRRAGGPSRVRDKASVAKKMSWAAKRTTSRKEDMAYCLLGLFDLNMPLLYGEGEKAFIRLQQELIRATDDETIFAWRSQERFLGSSAILASSPREFESCKSFKPLSPWKAALSQGHNHYVRERPPYTMTNKGLELRGGELRGLVNFSDDLLPLNCFSIDLDKPHFIAIGLGEGGNRRSHSSELYVCVLNKLSDDMSKETYSVYELPQGISEPLRPYPGNIKLSSGLSWKRELRLHYFPVTAQAAQVAQAEEPVASLGSKR